MTLFNPDNIIAPNNDNLLETVQEFDVFVKTFRLIPFEIKADGFAVFICKDNVHYAEC